MLTIVVILTFNNSIITITESFKTRRCFFCGSILLFMFHVCHAFMSVHYSLVVTCWEMAGLLATLCVMFSCIFVFFPCGVLGRVWYLIVSISDLRIFP